MSTMSMEAEIFGRALKRWRERRGLTQEGLAQEAGITTNYANQLENGRKVPSLTVILRLSLALQIVPADLLSDFTAAAMKRLGFDK
jgi:transcriptional regulator with XRE-family HTH domain